MAAVLTEGTSVVAWRTVRCLGTRCHVGEATLVAFVAQAFGEEAAAGYVGIPASVTLGAAVLLGELEAENRNGFVAAAGAGVATSDSKAA